VGIGYDDDDDVAAAVFCFHHRRGVFETFCIGANTS